MQDPSEQSVLVNAYFCAFFSYAFILLIEKVIFDSHSFIEHGEHIHRKHSSGSTKKNQKLSDEEENLALEQHVVLKSLAKRHIQSKDIKENPCEEIAQPHEDCNSHLTCDSCIDRLKDANHCEDGEELAIKKAISRVGKFTSYMEIQNISY